MDPKSYLLLKTSRDIQYNVFYVKPTTKSTTLLFLHGFPNSSYDWRYQVDFFSKLGYGVAAPDMLGFGGTDKPLETEFYATSLIGKDIIDVVDKLELPGSVIAVGHDWGSKITSHLANVYQDRFSGFVFLAVGHYFPDPHLTYKEILELTSKIAKREIFGYWAFFSEDDAAEIISNHWDSFWDCVLSFEPEATKRIATIGGLRSYLLEDIRTPLPGYLSPEEAEVTKNAFKQSGIKSTLNWYKVWTGGIEKKDAENLSPQSYEVKKPVFFGGALNDVICISAPAEAFMPTVAPNLTIRKYEASHWVQWEKRDELNQDIKEWLNTLDL